MQKDVCKQIFETSRRLGYINVTATKICEISFEVTVSGL